MAGALEAPRRLPGVKQVHDQVHQVNAARQLDAQQALACAPPTIAGVAEVLTAAAMAVTDSVGAALCNREGDELLGVTGTGRLSHVPGLRGPDSAALSGPVLESGRPEVSHDASCDPRIEPRLAELIGALSVVSLPIRRNGIVSGLLTVIAGHRNAYDDDAVSRLTSLCATAEARFETAAAMAELAAKEQQLREALETAVDGHALYDAVCDADGHVVDLIGAYLNSKGAMLRSLTDPHGWVGSSLTARAAEVGQPMMLNLLAVARTGEPRTFRLDLQTLQGFRSCNVKVTRRGPSERSGVSAVFHDVTDERRASDLLAEHERQLAEAQRLAGVGSWEWIPDPSDAGGILDGGGTQTWSDQLYNLLGLAPASIPASNANWTAAIVPEDRSVRTDAIRRLLTHHASSVDVQYRVQRPDGRTVWLQGTIEADYDEAGHPTRVHGTALDITRQRESEQQLRQAEEQFRLALDLAPVGVALLDLSATWLRVNDALCSLFGRSREGLLGEPLDAVFPPEDTEREHQEWIELISGELPRLSRERRVVRPDGTSVWVRTSASMLRGADGSPRHVIAHVEDVTGDRARQDDLERQANTDPLTALLNRRGWEQALLGHLDQAVATGEPLSIGLLDLDRFKVYNDTFGHPAGDRLLSEACTTWQAYLARCSTDATLARLGGEEFVVALPGLGAEEARELLAALCSLTPRGQTTSAGLTVWLPGEDSGETLARADGALYTAKRKGRNRVVAVLGA